MNRPANVVACVIVLAVTATAACVHVAPYQRGRLAHPTMLLVDQATPGAAHVYAIQEGATGGASAVEGGCGCN